MKILVVRKDDIAHQYIVLVELLFAFALEGIGVFRKREIGVRKDSCALCFDPADDGGNLGDSLGLCTFMTLRLKVGRSRH